jgi:hypothetical protein
MLTTPHTSCRELVTMRWARRGLQAYIDAMELAEHTWFTSDGKVVRRPGRTMLVAAAKKADVKSGMSALRVSDELVVDVAPKGKDKGKGALLAYRVANGAPLFVEEASLLPLTGAVADPKKPDAPVAPPVLHLDGMWISWCAHPPPRLTCTRPCGDIARCLDSAMAVLAHLMLCVSLRPSACAHRAGVGELCLTTSTYLQQA